MGTLPVIRTFSSRKLWAQGAQAERQNEGSYPPLHRGLGGWFESSF